MKTCNAPGVCEFKTYGSAVGPGCMYSFVCHYQLPSDSSGTWVVGANYNDALLQQILDELKTIKELLVKK